MSEDVANFKISGVIPGVAEERLTRVLEEAQSGGRKKPRIRTLAAHLTAHGIWVYETRSGDILISGARGRKSDLSALAHTIEDNGGYLVRGLRQSS